MKIGFINGPKDKKSIDTENYANKEVESIFKASDERRGFQVGFDSNKVYEYKRCLVKLNKEYKYFYVIDIHSIDDLKHKIEEYWHLSDIEGYDLN